MKKIAAISLSILALGIGGCSGGSEPSTTSENPTNTSTQAGQSAVQDDVSNPNIVQTAVGSPDHTTLVAAVQAAGLVDALSNAGPFTVFAPTNAAFEQLPAGTVEGLLKPANKADLSNILEYHTYVGVLKPEYLNDGQQFEQVNGQKISISKSADGSILVNGKAKIVGSVSTSNGMIHVLDQVLLPPAK